LEDFLKKLSIIYLIAFLMAALSLQAQTVVVDKTQLTFSAQVGTNPAPTQTITASSSATGTFFIAQASVQSGSPQWLKISNPSNPTFQSALTGNTGQSSGVVTVMADATGLSAGVYTGSISFNNTQLVTVTFSVGSIGVVPQTLTFAYQSGTTLPAASAVQLSGSGNYTVAVSTSLGGNWLTVTPTAGSLPTTNSLSIGLDPAITPTLAAGTYNGQVTITPSGSSSSVPAIVSVTLTVTAAPTATLSASAISLAYQIGGANNNASQTLSISTNSLQPLNFGVNSSANTNPSGRNWILVNPSSGVICQQAGSGCTSPANGSAQVNISYDTTANLPAGTWTGVATVFTPGTSPAQQNIPVNLLVSSSPLLSIPTSSLSFLYEINGATPAAQTVTAASTAVATSSTTGQMPITVGVTQGATWLSITPPTGVAPTQLTTGMPLTVSANPAGLVPGKYNGTITITGTGAGNGPQTINVTLTVANDPLLMTNAPSNGLTFESQIGQNPVANSQISQSVTVTSSSGATLNYNATSTTTSGGSGWLVLTGATSGSTAGTFNVSVNPSGLAKGTYTGTVTITATNPGTGNAALNSPINIPVTLYVDTNPMLVATLPGNPPAPPVFTASVNGTAPAGQTITVNSTNPSVTLNYNTTFSTDIGGNWLFVSPSGGSTAAGQNTINILVTPGLLSPGTYTGKVVITATGATVANSPITVPVTFTVTAGTLTLNHTSLTFTQPTGGAAPAAQSVQVTSNGQPLNFSAVASVNNGSSNWLSVASNTATGQTPGSISVTVDGSKLAAGTYSGTITVTAPNASTATLPVTLTVTAGSISAPTTTLTFTQVAGGGAPASQTVAVTGTPSPINFTVGTSVTGSATGWLTATVGTTNGVTGTTPVTVAVSVNAGTGSSALPVGTYNGQVTITAAASGSPISIPVVFNVIPAQTLTLSTTTPLSFSYTVGVTQTPITQTVNLTSSGSAQFSAAASTTDKGTWLSVTPTTGTATSTATPLTVSVNPTGLAAGAYTGTITITSPASVTPLTLAVNLTVAAVPSPVLVSIKNSASYSTGAVAPGELVTIFGTNVGPADLTFGAVASNKRATSVAGYSVLFDGIAAPVYYASANQTAVFVPYEISGRPTTQVTVQTQGATSTATTYNVVTAQPGIYTQNSAGSGPGSILNQDNSFNGPNNGAATGTIIQIFMTGEGETSPGGITGATTPSDGSGLKKPVLPVTATIGGQALTPQQIVYAGSAPGATNGVFQVDLIIPAGLSPGPQSVTVSVGGVPSQSGVTVQVK
jgi:uncharacterized protein (TIGR03437 family)